MTNIGGKNLNEYLRATNVLDHNIIAVTSAAKGSIFFISTLFIYSESFVLKKNIYTLFLEI